jgi:hypothetical protein
MRGATPSTIRFYKRFWMFLMALLCAKLQPEAAMTIL